MQLDELEINNSYRQLPEHWFESRVPVRLDNAFLASINPRVLKRLQLDAPVPETADLWVRWFASESPSPRFSPLAMKYAGHQFGVYNPQLGDGRGLLLGEVVVDGQRLDLHLKGAGRTAFSRFGDGRAVLRSTIREYLVGSAMHGLGIPTTEALCLFASDELAQRETLEPCAQLVRVTPCHIRFGHFEHFYYTRQHDDLKRLLDYSIERFYPHLLNESDPALAFFNEVVRRSAELVASWQAYGFVHGVLNTDNMSILGESFDFGPYTFMDYFDPGFVSNGNDHEGRYAFGRQPEIVLWNLTALAESLTPLVKVDQLERALMRYKKVYQQAFYQRMNARLGLDTAGDNEPVVDGFFQLASACALDINRFLRALATVEGDKALLELLSATALLNVNEPEALRWWELYQARVMADREQRVSTMNSVNPRFVLRNYMAQEAIEAAHKGDFSLVDQLITILEAPFDEHPGFEHFAARPPEWAQSIRLTCSS